MTAYLWALGLLGCLILPVTDLTTRRKDWLPTIPRIRTSGLAYGFHAGFSCFAASALGKGAFDEAAELPFPLFGRRIAKAVGVWFDLKPTVFSLSGG